jgi:ubiquinol-cytochrome c reductase cytochrome b subunit
MYDFYLILSILVLISPINLSTDSEKVVRIKGIYRIGPHNKNILSILFGSLLGDAHGEKRIKGQGTRFSFFQEDSHVEYIYFLHKLISDCGYCNPKIPTVSYRLGVKGKLRKIVKFST